MLPDKEFMKYVWANTANQNAPSKKYWWKILLGCSIGIGIVLGYVFLNGS